MNKFEKVSRFEDVDLPIPTRATHAAAGYDFVVAEDIVIQPYKTIIDSWSKKDFLICAYPPEEEDTGKTQEELEEIVEKLINTPKTLEEIAMMTKRAKAKPTLVSTGMKCQLASGHYLELSVRSSTPLKHWLILANGVGIIDADYYNNPDNEGEIFFQLINLSPYPIQLKRGDKIGQGIIKKYEVTDDDYMYNKAERAGGFGSTNSVLNLKVDKVFAQDDLEQYFQKSLFDAGM